MRKLSRYRVKCPYCNYRMPIEFDDTAQCHGVYIKCKGRQCKREFELVIKNGVQYSRSWVYDRLSKVFYSIF